MEDLLLGVHCKTAGGLENAFDEADRLGIDTFQIFTKNQRQWREKVIKQSEQKVFLERFRDSAVREILSHTSYLINLASGDPDIRGKSLTSLTGEIRRCTDLCIGYAVLHPGSAKDRGLDGAIEAIAEGLLQVLAETEGSDSMILLENTAGQGKTVGGEFVHLRRIMDLVGSPRIGVCFDTCHAFAAGYDIRTKEGFDSTFEELDQTVGFDNLKAIHMNDSKGTLGSHLDRHENIGHGEIGRAPFGWILETFPQIPKVLETPKQDDWDAKNLATLRELAAAKA